MYKYLITTLRERLFAARFEESQCVELKPVDSDDTVGDIYVARVENVVNNINSAFVEIKKGVKCYYSLDDNKRHLFINRKNNDKVNQGDLMLVQVGSAAVKTKPATAVADITLSGKYVVLSTLASGVLISKKTKSSEICQKHRERLIKEFDFNVLEGSDKIAKCQQYIGAYGFILRTNSSHLDTETVLNEATQLVKEFEQIVLRAFFCNGITQLYKAPPSYIEEIADLPTTDVEAVITDIPYIYDAIIEHSQDDIKDRIRLYEDKLLPLKSLYNLEGELDKALSKHIWLKCGGYIVIEQTEAMTVVDVNTGRFVMRKGTEEAKAATLLKVNKEAAKEIARQLQVRNISGIIIVDFINMKSDEHMQELLQYMKQMVKNDTQNCNVLDITRLGLVEMTRKRTGKPLSELM